jgi:hypothetical protein
MLMSNGDWSSGDLAYLGHNPVSVRRKVSAHLIWRARPEAGRHRATVAPQLTAV